MYYLGVDLGGTSIKAGLVNENYKVISQASRPTGREREAEAVLKDIAMLCQSLLEDNSLTVGDIHSIGIGSPGIASPQEGMILSASNLNFDHVDVRGEIQKFIDTDVYVENDANCAALGEALCGAAKGAKSTLVVTLGTGIGGGIIIDGKIHRGHFCGAGEIGHHVVQMIDGIPCGCGRTGCWEKYASATALIRMAQEAVEKNPKSLILNLAKDKKAENITAKVVFDTAQQGDATANNVLEQYFKNVAIGLTNLINILEPEQVVLGGAMSAQKDYLTKPVVRYIEEEMYGNMGLKIEIKTAILGNNAGIIGAALLGRTLE